MDQARTTISKIFNGEPRSYTRFNLTQNMEGENSQVELKLSSDVDEEGGGNGVGDHRHHNGDGGRPYVVRKTHRSPKKTFLLVSITLLIFIIGYLIGYLVHRKKEVPAGCTSSLLPSEEPEPPQEFVHETGAAPVMEWQEVKNVLDQKFTSGGFESTFSEFAMDSHQAGSPGDEALGNRVLKRFRSAGMHTWTDEHYVTLQDLPLGGANRVAFKDQELGRPTGYLAYSAAGNVTAPVVFASYGQVSELRTLRNVQGVSLEGKVLLVKQGRISFAEKVANAALEKAAAVLIYPDPSQSIGPNTQLYGHVHLGSGDPYTPGFPSFNHTQFPPSQSSGLPGILAQTITSDMAARILRDMGGPSVPAEWGGINTLGASDDLVTLEVNTVLAQKKIHNVFGLIKGFVDPDLYVVIGAQRDAWGPGFARSTVGTSVLVELSRAITSMIHNDGFKPRRSIVFASWSAGEYGSVGATEWLEGYLSSLSMKAFSYISLDGVVTGQEGFRASSSPLMHTLLQNTLKEVKMASDSGPSIYTKMDRTNWAANVLETMRMNDPAYPFLTLSGIPSFSFHFSSTNAEEYPYYGTTQDTREKLYSATSGQAPRLAVAAAQVAGHMALRLVHDHLLRLDVERYLGPLRNLVANINRRVASIQTMEPSPLPKDLTADWLISALGSFTRASRALATDIQNSDLEDVKMCRSLNERLMQVERDFLSPYVSPRDSPFRHILVGSGPHTLQALLAHLDSLKSHLPDGDADSFRVRLGLATWTVQGCANGLSGNVWSIDNQI